MAKKISVDNNYNLPLSLNDDSGAPGGRSMLLITHGSISWRLVKQRWTLDVFLLLLASRGTQNIEEPENLAQGNERSLGRIANVGGVRFRRHGLVGAGSQ